MLSAEEALQRTFDLISPLSTEMAPLETAMGRVLASPIKAVRDQPPFTASAMDGYAVRASDAVLGAALTVIGEIPAGGAFDGAIGAGQAVRIFTGAPVPECADAILIQEDAVRDGDQIKVTEAPATGAHLRPKGGDFQAGVGVPAPRRLTAAEIALAAAMNTPQLEVYRRPVVSLIATGDELVSPGGDPGPNQIISSNNYGLAAMLAAQGAQPVIQPIAADNREALTTALEASLDADLIVTLGGASVGDYDLVREVFGDGGMELSFYKVALRPGKPLMAGRVRGVPMIGLPGNPVSSMVLGEILLRPAMDKFQGLPAAPRKRINARLGQSLAPNGPREHYMRARLEDGPDGKIVFPFPNQDSSLLSVLANANALAIHPAKAPQMAAGDEIEVIEL